MEDLEERILHVDEDDTTQYIVRGMFEKNNVSVESAGTFDEAVELLKNKNYQGYTCLVINAELYGDNGKNGIDLARYILKKGFDSDRYPIVLIAPKSRMPELNKLPEVQQQKISLIEEAEGTEEPNEKDLIALYLSRRGL